MVLHFVHAVANRQGAGLGAGACLHLWHAADQHHPPPAQPRCGCRAEAAGAEAQDWQGGTRIGACLHAFNRDWSRRVLGQGAVVLLITDGLDRDDRPIWRSEMERLHLSARRVIWLNPLAALGWLCPARRGIRAMLPHVDSFRAGHSIASLERWHRRSPTRATGVRAGHQRKVPTMKRLLTTTTAFSVALAGIAPLPLQAQTRQTLAEQGIVCLTSAERICAEGLTCHVIPEPPCDDPAEIALAKRAEAKADTAARQAERAATVAANEARRAAQAAKSQSRAEAAAAKAEQAAETATAPTDAPVIAPAGVAAPGTAPADAAAPSDAAGAGAAEKAEAAAARQAAAKLARAAARAEEKAARDAAALAPGATASPPVSRPRPARDTAAAAAALDQILTAPDQGEAAPLAAAQDAAGADAGDDSAGDATTVTAVTKADTRSSDEDFAASPPATEAAAPTATGRSGLSDLEKFGLVVLGGLVVGAILKNGNKVVSNTGDRVVVEDPAGNYTVMRDDDTLVRRPGSTVSTRSYADGSTRSVVTRADGSRIVTVRDASGRVLRRERIDADGRSTLLLDDLAPATPINITTLPRPVAMQPFQAGQTDGDALRAALLAAQARDLGRSFSLRQIREYPEVRALAPTIDVASITFRTGSAAIDVTEADKLSRLGNLIADLVRANPAEMFLIEGHTDAVGSAAYNLALSDRRAESVALALSEYFRVPPENMVVQGYGEQELRIPTQAGEPLNRRAAVRVISPLLRQIAAN
jgi:outer membrane protein OmpA-like peptidoglycan-associated protein